ncbi:hypothetical protein Hanom_Chr14g01330671 [Helianthus anomalus]
MELTSQMKMARFQTFWIKMRENKPLDESRKSGQTSGMKMAFYSSFIERNQIIFEIMKILQSCWTLTVNCNFFYKWTRKHFRLTQPGPANFNPYKKYPF